MALAAYSRCLLSLEIGLEKVKLFLCDALGFDSQVVSTRIAKTLVFTHLLPIHLSLRWEKLPHDALVIIAVSI